MRGMKAPDQEAREEAREASTPGARGKEPTAPERVGDEHRRRGGFLPEETEASEKERSGAAMKEKKPDMAEAKESYADEGDARKRGGRMAKRARGGGLDAADEHKKHQPAHHPRKRGGKVPGKTPKSRPDRRARGGATADLSPHTAAGNMSVPDYERQKKIPNGGGVGPDTKGDKRLD